ncbi:MAG: acyl-[acyl-carrier-protein] thioesterase [Bacteroidales bacterium]
MNSKRLKDNSFEINYELRHFEMNKFGEASPAIMLALLEEAAAEHCYSIGYGLYDLIKENIGWVLLSGVMKMERYPRYKEKILIRTWLSKYSTVRGFRENIVYDGEGNVIGRAKGLWMFFDIKRRRPVPVFDEIVQKWSFIDEEAIEHNIAGKIDPVQTGYYKKEFRVRQSEIDMYLHVNNIKYLQWLLDSIPDEVIENNFLHFVDGRFISEIKYSDEVVIFSRRNSTDNSFFHTIKIKDTDRICASATTRWKPRT